MSAPAGNDQAADQQQQQDKENQTHYFADVLVTAAGPPVTAGHRVVQKRIRKTWISHGILHSSGRFVSSQHEENPLAVTAVPNLDPAPLDEVPASYAPPVDASEIMKVAPLGLTCGNRPITGVVILVCRGITST